MPSQQGNVSALLKKFGQRALLAHEAHKGDETILSSLVELPPGLKGVARLCECKFDVVKPGNTNAGEYFFYAAAIIESPIHFTYSSDPQSSPVTMKVQGLRTIIMEPMYDTPTRTRKTFEEHLAWVYNELRKLGLDTSSLSLQDIELAGFPALIEAAPLVQFRTWKGPASTTGEYAGKESRVLHFWEGTVEATDSERMAEFTEDSTEQVVREIKTPNTPPKAPSSTPPTKISPPKVVTPIAKIEDTTITKKAPIPSVPAEGSDTTSPAEEDKSKLSEEDILQLGAIASSDEPESTEAQASLVKAATDCGISIPTIESAESWDDVASLILLTRGTTSTKGDIAAEDNAAVEEEEVIPSFEPGTRWTYFPMDPKTKNRTSTPVLVEIISTNPEKHSVVIRSVSDPSKKWAVSEASLTPLS